MKYHLRWILPVIVVLCILVGFFGFRLYRQLTTSFNIEVADTGFSVVETPVIDSVSQETIAQVRDRLGAAGLQDEGVLVSTGIDVHVKRLQKGEISAETLLDYADNLIYIRDFTTENGAEIPISFFDFQSDLMRENGLDEYTVVYEHTIEGSEPYLLLLTKAYERFTDFKAKEAGGGDSALDAALDFHYMVDDYYQQLSELPDPKNAEAVDAYNDAKLMVWQSLVAGTSRINPLTGEPLFSHSIFGHYSVAEMWRYAQDENMGISEIWGLSGFAPEFVGIPENANQIEHMSISSVLQMVLDEPVAVLDGIEEEKVIAGGTDQREASADMALNNAIHRTMGANFDSIGLDAVEELRCTLKGGC